MPQMLVVQHARCETLGTISEAVVAARLRVRHVRSFEGEPVPREIGGAAGLIAMGGPMGVYEQARYPFLRDELRLIESALREGVPILGVCLGSQLLARALGAEVRPGKQKEIGWHPVRLASAARDDALWSGVASPFVAFAWHGDVFDLPAGAVHLASSELTEYQAFRHGSNAYGLLFHLEVTGQQVSEMAEAFADELRSERIDGRAMVAEARNRLPDLHRVGSTVFRRWAEMAVTRRRE